MPTAAVEREELQQIIQRLPDEKIPIAVSLIRELCINSDPFYSESNMKHLRAVKAEAEAGLNMYAHDLIEADDA